ncbi:hypothetical protein EDF24_0712 [Curtobacterium sp. PhB130]|uniref:hypothetical protein n=1 Tax=Curtobacterium sp. PhB130 TaxID=2485178 RepID=UPI000FA88F3F|nr:hypothetical protein [Curtobacterium sp. PhB130]ROS77943.1 hypothetical protein EDF24_0712 [Curtobacterium sp. PhB130]
MDAKDTKTKTKTDLRAKRDRRAWLSLAVAAVAVSIVGGSIAGSQADAALDDGGFSVKASSDGGQFIGMSGGQGKASDETPGQPAPMVDTGQRGSVTVQRPKSDAGKPVAYRILDGSGQVVDQDSDELSANGYLNFNTLVPGPKHPAGSTQDEIQAQVIPYSVELDFDGQTYRGEFEADQSVTTVYDDGYSQIEMGAWRLTGSDWAWSIG